MPLLKEKLLFLFARIPEWLHWLLAATFLALLAQFFLQYWLWTGLAFLPVVILVESITRSPKFLGELAARRNSFAFLFALLLLLFSLFLFFQSYSPISDSPRDLRLHLGFVVVGLLIGLLLRRSLGRVVFLALLGKRRLGEHTLFLANWTLALILFPTGSHSFSQPWYVAGVALGILLQRGSRIWWARQSTAYRRLQDIADAWPPKASASPAELEALQLLADGRQLPSLKFHRLTRRLRTWKESNLFSDRLRLINVAVCRLEGRFEEALEETREVPLSPPDVVSGHLLLFRILSLDEVGREQESSDILDSLLESDPGGRCPIARAVKALKIAENALEEIAAPERTDEALNHVMQSLQLRNEVMRKRLAPRSYAKDSLDAFLGRFADIGVPLTPSFLLDVLAYSHLAAGFSEMSRLLLRRCIQLDPDYSYSYLHLGEYYLFRKRIIAPQAELTYQDIWHARAAYGAAQMVELNPNSRVRRLALRRLEQITAWQAER